MRPVRIKSYQEPATVDVQRAVIAKRGNAPTILVNSPVGDSQSNGRVENAFKKVRNVVKTIHSSLGSRWGVRVARDHPVYPWVFEWAADLMTRYAHVGDLGKTAVQLIRGSKSSRNIAQFGEKILYKPLKLSGHLRGNMEDTLAETKVPCELSGLSGQGWRHNSDLGSDSGTNKNWDTRRVDTLIKASRTWTSAIL